MTFNEGDQVYVYSSGRFTLRKAVISRVTKTQAIIANDRYEEKFNRETGRMVGGGAWDSTRIDYPTPGLDKQYLEQRKHRAASMLSEAARKGDAADIRAAYARWDRLEREEKS